jgi:pilus assembly protein CpaE
MTTIVEHDPTGAETLQSAVASDCTVVTTFDALRRHLDQAPTEDCVVVGASVALEPALELANEMRVARPQLGVVLVRRRVDTSVLGDALRAGVREVVEERNLAGVDAAVQRVLELARAMRDQVTGSGPAADSDSRGTSPTAAGATSAWSTSTCRSATSLSPCRSFRRTRSPTRSRTARASTSAHSRPC